MIANDAYGTCKLLQRIAELTKSGSPERLRARCGNRTAHSPHIKKWQA